MTVKFYQVEAGDEPPADVASWVPATGHEGCPRPVLIGDVVVAVVGDNAWLLPAHDVSGWAAVDIPCSGNWDLRANVVTVMTAQTWDTPSREVPSSVAGIDLSSGSAWQGPVAWEFKRGDVAPDWLMSYSTDDPGVHVDYVFEGDVAVVDLSYATWVLPAGFASGPCGIKPIKSGQGRATMYPTTRVVAWPVMVTVGFREGGGGGNGPVPVDPVAPVSPVLEPA